MRVRPSHHGPRASQHVGSPTHVAGQYDQTDLDESIRVAIRDALDNWYNPRRLRLWSGGSRLDGTSNRASSLHARRDKEHAQAQHYRRLCFLTGTLPTQHVPVRFKGSRRPPDLFGGALASWANPHKPRLAMIHEWE